LLPLLFLGAALVAARVRRRERPHAVPWHVASWIGPLVAIPVLAFTTVMIVADTAKTSSWTLARQNLDTLSGGDTACGLGEDLLVSVRSSARSLAPAGDARERAVPAWVPATPVVGLQRYALGPTPEGAASTAWFELPTDRRFGLFVTGAPGSSDRLRIEWSRQGATGLSRRGAKELDTRVGPMSGDAPWRFYAAGDLPRPPAWATAVRVTLSSDIRPGPAVAVTAPVTYANERLANRMTGPESRTLVLPNLLTYFPCTRLPLLAGGIVEAPDHIVSWRNQFSPFRYQLTSPFIGVLDLYDLEHIPTTDSENAPADVLAYRVDQRIPGAKLAPPTALTSSS
jgi:hypothetical protein